jgi:tRNA A37 threonylcarbamoyladenosine biosynthesis protein TsaE
MITEAILKIKSDAQVSVSGTNIDTCNIEWHDGNPTNITKEQIKVAITEIEQEKQDTINKKASGKQKLLDLGLTEDEVKALIGI